MRPTNLSSSHAACRKAAHTCARVAAISFGVPRCIQRTMRTRSNIQAFTPDVAGAGGEHDNVVTRAPRKPVRTYLLVPKVPWWLDVICFMVVTTTIPFLVLLLLGQYIANLSPGIPLR